MGDIAERIEAQHQGDFSVRLRMLVDEAHEAALAGDCHLALLATSVALRAALIELSERQ